MPHSPLLLLLLLPFLLLSPHPARAAEGETAYDVLRQNGLPMGILPKGVKAFQIDPDGNFEAQLDGPCTARFESDVRYESAVTGTITYGQIKSLSGVSAQELFLWFPVKGIRVDVPSSGVIYFDVGVIYKQYSLSLFETPPDCHAATLTIESRPEDDGAAASVVAPSTKGTPENLLSMRIHKAKRNTAL